MKEVSWIFSVWNPWPGGCTPVSWNDMRQVAQYFVSKRRKKQAVFLHFDCFLRSKSLTPCFALRYHEATTKLRQRMKRREHHSNQDSRLHQACRRHLRRRRQGQHHQRGNCATRLRLVLKEVPSADAPQTKQGIGSRIIATMSAVFAPFVYILAAGLVQGALIIITTLLRPLPKPALIRCSASSAGLPSPSCRS